MECGRRNTHAWYTGQRFFSDDSEQNSQHTTGITSAPWEKMKREPMNTSDTEELVSVNCQGHAVHRWYTVLKLWRRGVDQQQTVYK